MEPPIGYAFFHTFTIFYRLDSGSELQTYESDGNRKTLKKAKVRTRGTVEFNLDGGDAALVETAVEITLVTCRSEFVSGDFS